MSRRCWLDGASRRTTKPFDAGLKFGRLFAQNLRRSRPRPTGRWHLDEMVVKISGKRMWLWRAVDDEGEVLDVLVQKRRNTKAAMRLFREAPEEYRRPSRKHSHRSVGVVWSRCARAGHLSSPPAGAYDWQQPSGEFTPAHSSPRAQTTEVQISSFSAEIPRHSRSRLQHLQFSASHDPPIHPSPLPSRC